MTGGPSFVAMLPIGAAGAAFAGGILCPGGSGAFFDGGPSCIPTLSAGAAGTGFAGGNDVPVLSVVGTGAVFAGGGLVPKVEVSSGCGALLRGAL